MRHDRAQDAGQVPAREGHRRLRALVVVRLAARQRLVDLLHDRLKRRKLHHRVRDLPAPQGIETLEEATSGQHHAASSVDGRSSPCRALLSSDGCDPGEGSGGERRDGGLHPHLDGLERAERDIRNKLRRCAGGQVQRGLPAVGSLLSDDVAVELFEKLIAAVFERSLRLSSNISAGFV